MARFIFFIWILFGILYSTTARKDRTQTVLENHLTQVSNKVGLISNDTFAHKIFDSFRNHHPRQYQKPDNETTRFQVFHERLQAVLEHDLSANTTLTFTVGLNKFSDWTPPELQTLRGNKPPPSDVRAKFVTMTLQAQKTATSQAKATSTSLPTFDYTTRVSAVNTSVSVIRPVRDQGQCGSCYAFSLITLVEAQYAFQYGQAVNMSEQQIIDCSPDDLGCTGGYFDTAFAYLKSYNWYMDSATSYPYTAVASNCSAKKTGGWAAGDFVYRHVPTQNVTAMQQALITYGPLWISIYVGSDCSGIAASACPVGPQAAKKIMNTFQSYKGGIYQANGCVTSADNNNHAMVIVGYGYDSATKLDYWKLRNSWGDEWGEDGYVKIRRGVNMCNVESDVFFIAKPAP